MLLTSLLSLLAPHECLGCSAEGALLCATCRGGLSPAIERCYECHEATIGGRTCPNCLACTPLYAVRAATKYEGTAKDLLWKLKFGRARAAADEIGAMLARTTARRDMSGAIVTHIPTATNRVRQRGYDQARLIAKAFAQTKSAQYTPLLRRSGNVKQVGASRSVRTAQLANVFRPIHTEHIRNAHIILVDDVVTTGATLATAAEILRDAGARRVEAVVFAQA